MPVRRRAVILVRHMERTELSRIAEIDRSEHVTREYIRRGASLEQREVDIQVPPWSREGAHDHSIRGKINAWQPTLDGGGLLLGAFEDEILVGFAVLQPDLTPDMANLAVLHVSGSHRRQGVGALLTQEVVSLARSSGARQLYVSATPSAPTVDFYKSEGFELVTKPHAELLRAEPDDIHMILNL